ncbi:MAG: sulfite exporter TauE/SafE family protein [Dehalococcoidia bacterium]|nr:MAG: sulfite exporter TauE/SafE family protein [Dehalococcoidia bacterium]
MEFGDLVQRISESVSFPLLSAFLIGIMAAISPCPLATNISAMAYISRNVTDRRYVITSGLLYTLGRTVSYFIVGALVITGSASIPRVALFLQDAGERFLGPLLIVVGIFLLGIINIPFFQGGGRLASIGEKVAKRGRTGAFLLGVVFALAFCPYTAILFFGILVPLALESTAGVTLPASFAMGTGLPVLIFAVLLSFGITKVAQWLNVVTAVEKVIRKIAAVLFIGIGIYFVVLWIQG